MVGLSKDHFDFNNFFGVSESEDIVELSKCLDVGNVDDEAYYLPETNKYGSWILAEGRKLQRNCLMQLRQSVLRPQEPGLCPTLTANMGRGGHNVPFLIDNGRLRKLTEKECLRLQGFPETFKWPEVISRTKYRLIGNAVVPRVARKIATELRAIIEEGDANDDRLGVSN